MAKAPGKLSSPKKKRTRPTPKGDAQLEPRVAATPKRVAAMSPRPIDQSAPPLELPMLRREWVDNSVGLFGVASGPRSSARTQRAPDTSARRMELHWGDDDPPARPPVEGVVTRWVKRGDTLLRHLAEHGVARHEYRVDLQEGRFVWIDPGGRVSAEAHARVLCSWSQATSVVLMAWADPLVRSAAVARIDGVASERDDLDEEGAWRVAMEAADTTNAEFLYRVTTPHAWYFLALSNLTFSPARPSFSPSTPVGLVLQSLSEARLAVESRAEPIDVLRERILSLGRALGHEAEYAYRDTDWVARLERAGRRLIHLSEGLPRSSFNSVAAGRPAPEWLNRETTIDLAKAIALLEDEWALFA